MDRLTRIAGAIWRRNHAAGLILMYHRVGEVPLDPWGLAVSPGHFEEHLEVLRKRGRPLPLARAVRTLQHQRLPAGALVVTFDDGYADNLSRAQPLLERYDVPATVFLTTGHIGRAGEFWWDELEQILLAPEVLPAELSLSPAGRTPGWVLGEARHYPEDIRQSDRRWRITGHGAPGKRYELYRAVHRMLRRLAADERRSALNELSAWARVTVGARASHRCLSPDEVLVLARGGLTEIGSHTVTHPVLPSLAVASQREEIRRSKFELEQLLGRPVTSFAYPYGQHAAETSAVVREAGYESACSGQAGLLGRQTDLFSLPRIKVEDWDGEGLARLLSDWFNR